MIHHFGTVNKPSNCLTLVQQISIFWKKPLEGSSGLGNSFFWSKNILNHYFLFVTNSALCYWAMRFIQNFSLHGRREGVLSKTKGGLLLDLYTQREGG